MLIHGKSVRDRAPVCAWNKPRLDLDSQVRSRRFLTKTLGGAACGTLEQMLEGPIHSVYIATHPDSHHAYAMEALAAGKHVLCEKPSMLNGTQLAEVLAAARSRGLLFMEAMKPPFFPLCRKLRQHLDDYPIGLCGQPHGL